MRPLSDLSWGLWSIAAAAVLSLVLWGLGAERMEDRATDHLKRHRQLLRQFEQVSAGDPQRALAFARSAVAEAEPLRRNDPRRGDALELLAWAHVGREEFGQALAPATEAVRIRKAARPVDHELLALALGTQAVALFALERSEAADEALREQLAAWRQAFGADDVRLAQKLEGQAEYVQAGFGRMRWAIELLKEAAAIREAAAGSSAGRLAQTLQQLAIYQMRASQYGEADLNLAKAQRLLEAEIARDGSREKEKVGLSGVLVLRAGIAGARAQRERALAFADYARGLELRDRALRAENKILVALGLSSVLELMGDVEGAIAEWHKILDVFRSDGDLFDSGALDIGLIPDTFESLGALYLEQDELDLARETLTWARQQLGDTSSLLFKMSELERKSGDEAGALRYYQEALRLRKTDASEISLFFGTNRRLEQGPEPARFGGEPSDRLSLGDAVVLVPGAQFSTETWLQSARPVPIPVGMATNPARLVMRDKKVLSEAAFRADVRRSMDAARLYPRSALVFVHGFNVPFDSALARGAQLARDLNFDGAAFAFSWPSRAKPWRYGTDRVTAGKAAASLVDFLGRVEAATGAEQIHLIAHSMGNRVLLPALLEVARDSKGTLRSKIGEVILAAPAVPQAELIGWMDELGRHGFHRFTLYAASVDKALIVGYVREWGTVLAGYVASGEPLVHGSIESIDVSEAGGDILSLNHDIFASNPVVTEDIRQLLQTGQRPPDRRIPTLDKRSTKRGKKTYWYYRQRGPDGW